ncbi:MAG TPA: alpha/beta hydrolase [Nocardioidaceae bacterium]|nr:alpha/beta hydrolase [Nocardioidaceae bacterium]
MSRRRWLGLGAAGLGATAAAVGAGVVVDRRVTESRRAVASDADRLGGLRGDAVSVRTSDGLLLHAEVDEAAPYSEGTKSRIGPPPGDPTLVFVHGFALNLDCWVFQRQYFRGKHRMVFYDQRSHGRSQRSDNEHATVDQTGDDLLRVLQAVVPDGPVVLVGHSMGGMSVMAFAERHPDVFEDRVVGAALISTTAGGLKTHRIVSRLIPDRIGGELGPRLVAALAKAPRLVDGVRRRGSNLGFLVADQFAFGSDVPDSYVELVDTMLAATPFEVLAQFFPNFDTHDKFTALESFGRVPTYVVTGTKDRLTAVAHSRTMASRIPGAVLVECPGAGHLVILEQRDPVNDALDDLLAAVEPGAASRVS